MANRQTVIRQTDAKRLFKAALDAGFSRARLTTYPDGRIEIIGDIGGNQETETPLSPFEQWKCGNANKD